MTCVTAHGSETMTETGAAARLGREGKHPASARHAKIKRRGDVQIPCFEAESDWCGGRKAKHQAASPSALEYFPSSNPGSRFQLDGLTAEPSRAKSWAGLAQGMFRAKADITA